MKHHRQFVHQRDVEIALHVLDDFCRLGGLDIGRTVNAGSHDQLVRGGNRTGGFFILPGDHLHHIRKAMLAVAKIDSLR